MEFLDIAEKIIPGYSLLSLDERLTFQVSATGQNFITLIKKIKKDISHLQHSLNLFNLLFSSIEKEKEQLADTIKKQIELYKAKAKKDKAFQLIKDKCDFLLLAEDFPKLNRVEETRRQQIINQVYSQAYLHHKIDLKKRLEEARGEFSKVSNWQNQAKIKELEKQYKDAQQTWLTNFDNDLELTELRNNLNLGEIKENLFYLIKYFHLLNYRINTASSQTELEKLLAAINLSNKTPEEINKLEKEQLSSLIYYCMDQISIHDLQFINLKQFNQDQANLIADAILQAFNNHTELSIHELLQQYHQKIKHYIEKQLLLINDPWTQEDKTDSTSSLNSLSYLLSHPIVNQANEFLRRLSDAHAFIQATGFATQNESSFLAIFDFYNYNRAANQVAEAKSILTNLFSPFLPLYTEYKEIALYEKSIFWKLYRTVMPVIIAVSFIVLVASLLSPLGLPELAFAAVFIPALFIGIALATKYVQVKDKVYNGLREAYYGGAYEIPEFQINERMLASFGNYDKAKLARDYYIEAIKTCIELDKFYQSDKEKGILTTEQLEAQKDNAAQLNLLYLEWYDIHSNNELSYTAAPDIIFKRLRNESKKEYQALKETFNQELTKINEAVDRAVNDLEKTLDPKITKNPKKETLKQMSPTLEIHYTPKLFKPRCLTHQQKAQKYVDLAEQLSQPKII
ncbi:Uncharacterised protein [Legionella busanensis]|uniref:Uncharacterized protein n=1 Tax=Legionella busanensis TaxID=190655 RepID=A0A378JQK4_9GAMM|nr:hypothetical protein [Legionella busanensis]STX52190.1 Uncharacterised protein [Legionella busanensis]